MADNVKPGVIDWVDSENFNCPCGCNARYNILTGGPFTAGAIFSKPQIKAIEAAVQQHALKKADGEALKLIQKQVQKQILAKPNPDLEAILLTEEAIEKSVAEAAFKQAWTAAAEGDMTQEEYDTHLAAAQKLGLNTLKLSSEAASDLT